MNLVNYVGCSDCQTVWNGFCYLCKQKVPDYREIKCAPEPPKVYAKPKKKRKKSIQKLLNAGHQEKCVCCGATANLTYDHIIPKSMGGYNSVPNGQILCVRCNWVKADRRITVEDLQKEIEL